MNFEIIRNLKVLVNLQLVELVQMPKFRFR
jgi:hypothetical protein